MRRVLPLLPVLLASCATIADGGTQIVAITTDPPGAACVVDQAGAVPGMHLDEVPSTPGTVLLPRSGKTLRVTCAIGGKAPVQVAQVSGTNPASSVNILNAGIGNAIDVSSGAFYRYPNEIHVSLNPKPPAPPKPAAETTPATGAAAPKGTVTPTPLAPPEPPKP